MGTAPYRRGEAIDDDDSGIIQLGIDNNEKLQIIPTETIDSKILREQKTLNLLESIDNSLLTLLKHFAIINDVEL